MDRGGVAAAIISITNPGLYFGDPAVTRRLALACNEYGAELVQAHPTRFGLFAAMPLPDVDATLAEIEYAYDTLNVDGVGVMTSYDENMWLGDPAFRPVMAELDRRRAGVHLHPPAANCCRNLAYGVAPGRMEYATDTSRALWVSRSAATPRCSPIFVSSGRTPAGRCRFWQDVSTPPPPTLRIAYRTDFWSRRVGSTTTGREP